MKVVFFIISIALVLFSSGYQLGLLRLSGFAEKVLAFLLIAAANIVISTLILSELYAISASGYIIIQLIIAIVSALCFYKFGVGPREVDAGQGDPGAGIPDNGRIERLIVATFFIAIVVVALISLFLALYVSPNNGDSLGYHLTRIFFWLQHGTLRHYYTPDSRQLYPGPNAEIFIMWTIAFLKSEVMGNVVQWLAYVGLGFAIYRTSIVLGFRHRAGLFAALCYLSLNKIVLESSSTQNDLVVIFFALTSFSFFHSGLKRKDKGHLLLSAIACGLAYGTKGTMFFITPVVVLGSILLATTLKAKPRLYIRWVSYCVAGFILLGSYNYILNYFDFGNIFAPKKLSAKVMKKNDIKTTFQGMVRYSYEAAEFTGLPKGLEEKLNVLKVDLGKEYLTKGLFRINKNVRFNFKTRKNFQEDYGWFGFVGFFVLVPVTLYFLFRPVWLRRFDERFIYAIIPIGFLIFICYSHPYSAFKGRFFVLPLAFMAPLAATLFSIKGRALRNCLLAVVFLIAANASLHVVTHNSMKHVFGRFSVFKTDYYTKKVIGRLFMQKYLRFIDELVPSGSRLGLIIGRGSYSSIYFGKDLSRIVFLIKPEELKERGVDGVMESHSLDYLFVESGAEVLNTSSNLIYRSNRSVIKGNKNQGYISVYPAKGWKKTALSWVNGEIEEENINNVLNMLVSAHQPSVPMRLVLDKASEGGMTNVPPVVLWRLKSDWKLAPKEVGKLRYKLVMIPVVKGGAVVTGAIEGADDPVVNIYDENGVLLDSVRTDKNGAFEFDLSNKDITVPGNFWRLYRFSLTDGYLKSFVLNFNK